MSDDTLFQAARPAILIAEDDAESFDARFRELRDDHADEDVTVLKLRGAKCRTLAGFFNEIAAVMQLPHYFGETWDALRDLFYDQSWLPGTLIMLLDSEQLLAAAPNQELRNFVELMDHCNTFYLEPPYKASAVGGTGFHVLMQVTPMHRAELEARLIAAGAEFATYAA